LEPPSFILFNLLLLGDAALQNAVAGFGASLDPTDTAIQISVIVLGLIFSALFSSSEVAYFSQENRNRFTDADRKLDATEIRVKSMLDHPRRLLATILIGNTFANIIVAVFAAVLTGNLVEYIGAPTWLIYSVEVVVITFTIVILTEITPKVLALKNAIEVSRSLSLFLYFFFLILKPFTTIVAKSALRIEHHIPKPSDAISSDDIKTIAEVGELQGTLRGEEREIIENVIEFGNTTVKEIMTSRVNMVAVSTTDTLEDVIKLIQESSISRFPLYENDLDNIVGIIHSKDLLPYLTSAKKTHQINWKTTARKPFFIPMTKKIDDLLKDFQRERVHVAIVVDEYGGTEGLVTLDDVLEEIIGEIHDENSGQERLYTRRKNGDYIFDAKIDLDEVGDILDRELTSDDDEYETLGGLVYHLLERIPEANEKTQFKDLELTVHEVENNRVKKIRVKVLDEEQKASEEPEEVPPPSPKKKKPKK